MKDRQIAMGFITSFITKRETNGKSKMENPAIFRNVHTIYNIIPDAYVKVLLHFIIFHVTTLSKRLSVTKKGI